MAILVSNLENRRIKDQKFVFLAKLAAFSCVFILGLILLLIIYESVGAFKNTYVSLEIKQPLIQKTNKDKLDELINQNVTDSLLKEFVKSITTRHEEDKLQQIDNDTKEINLKVISKIDQYIKHKNKSSLHEIEIESIEKLNLLNIFKVRSSFDVIFSPDSREPEKAGAKVAIAGTIYTMLISLIIAVPIGIISAIYLEEIARKNSLNEIIEVNISNLSSVPSIVYGLLGLTIFIMFFKLPRSSSLVAGLTLSIMILPTLVVSTRQALRAIPISIRHAALGLGASNLQTIFHHLIPVALPGILTGLILGLARILGEAAPLIMLGMVAFIANTPSSIIEPSTVIPVQIYLWATSIDAGYVEKTFAAILILMIINIFLNLLVFWVRSKYERTW